MFKWKIKIELENTALRIQQYLKEFELSVRGNDEELKKNWVYMQQRGKLTAYLYFLGLLGDYKFVNKIKKERGTIMVDEKTGMVKDFPIYLEGISWEKGKL